MKKISLKIGDIPRDFADWYVTVDRVNELYDAICEECGWLSDTPEFLHGYINYQKLGRDMEVSGNFLFNYDYGFIVEIYN